MHDITTTQQRLGAMGEGARPKQSVLSVAGMNVLNVESGLECLVQYFPILVVTARHVVPQYWAVLAARRDVPHAAGMSGAAGVMDMPPAD